MSIDPKEYIMSYIKEGPYYKEDNGQPDNDWIYNILIENTVWTGDISEHRWYSVQDSVAKVGDKYITFGAYIITGDNSYSDMGICPISDRHLVFVEPYEVTATEYRTVKEENNA